MLLRTPLSNTHGTHTPQVPPSLNKFGPVRCGVCRARAGSVAALYPAFRIPPGEMPYLYGSPYYSSYAYPYSYGAYSYPYSYGSYGYSYPYSYGYGYGGYGSRYYW